MKRTIVAAALFLQACQVRCNAGVGGAQPGPRLAAAGPETWTIEGKSWRIESTYYLALPEGLQFTLDVPVEKVPELEATALEQAWPVIRHVYVEKIYLRARVSAFGADNLEATRIGVSFFRKEGMRTHGMRVAMSVGEIRDRLQSEGAPSGGARKAGPHPNP
jgi:hypothetical protein